MAKNSITLNVRSKWPEIKDDYVVSQQGVEIGRIRLALDASVPETAWEWYIVLPMAVPNWTRGTANSRDTAIRDFSSAWGRFLKEANPARLQRALEFERAAQSRLPRKEVSSSAV